MSAAYWSAILEHLPEASIVFDHFHIIKLANEKIDDLRLTRDSMRRFLERWIARALDSGIRQMESLAKTLRAHATGILNYSASKWISNSSSADSAHCSSSAG